MPLFRCDAVVMKKDQLRFKRGKGFVMHYNREQCTRAAEEGGLCWQHRKLVAQGGMVFRWTR